jgi:hypothetical protein
MLTYPIDVSGGVNTFALLGNGPDPSDTTDPNSPGLHDCLDVALVHYRVMLSVAFQDPEIFPTTDQVVAAYLARDNQQDNGEVISVTLADMLTAGSVLGYAKVDVTDGPNLDSVLGIGRGVVVGANLTADAQHLYNLREEWTTANGETPAGGSGHVMIYVGTDGATYRNFASWTNIQEATLPWCAACLTEGWTVFLPEHLSAGAAATGYSSTAHIALIKSLGGVLANGY